METEMQLMWGECPSSADVQHIMFNKEEWHIKTKFNLLRRMTVWVVTAAMLLTSLPLMSVTTAAYDDGKLPKSTSYTVKTTVANERNAKTDNDVYCIVKDATGREHSILLDKKGDDFQKGETDEYTFTLDLYPWEIHAVGFEHKKGADAVKLHKFSFWATIDGTKHMFVEDKVINTWFHKYKKTYGIAGKTDRRITSRGNFDTQFGRTEYYEADTIMANSVSPTWNGLVSDQYFSNYSIFEHAGAVGIDFSASGKSHNGKSSINMSVLTDGNNPILQTIDNKLGYTYGMDLNRNQLLLYMWENQIYKFTLTSKLDYLYDYDEYDSYSKTWTIIRKGFDLGSPTAITKAYTPVKDQNFYNSNASYNTFEIKIPVKNFDHYDAATIAKSLAYMITRGIVPARIYYDKVETNRYITPKNAYSKGSDVYLVCDTPSGFNNPGGVGITVQLDDVQAVYGIETYKLDHQISADNTSRSNDYSEKITTHKVDTKGVELKINDSDSAALNSYKKTHSFSIQETNNEQVYVENNGTRSQGYFSYELLTKDGKTVKALKNYKTTPTTKVPYATNAVYTVEPKETLEGDYLLRISARDLANNPSAITYPIKIDAIAPRVSYKLKQLAPVDGSKRNEYTFTLEDATGTGTLYYCIVPKGETMAEPGNDIPEHTGAVESQYNRWAFINQNGAAKTAVVSVASGHNFEGTLYWYTVDAAGNDSRAEKNKGSNSAGYYYTNISIENENVSCKLIVDDSAPGRPSYNISFETNAANRVEYYWRGTAIETRKTVYTANSNPGAAWQTLTTGSSVQMNGEYTLVYTVTTPGGTTETHTQKFVFDNTNPIIKMSYANDAVSAEKAITVDVSDITNIEKLSYQLCKATGIAADGTPIGLPVGDIVELSCGLPVVRADLMLEPEEPGMYYISLTATDVNGQTSMQTSEIFGIRNGQPVQVLDQTVDFHITADKQITYPYADTINWVNADHNGIPLTNQRELTFKWTVTEPIANIAYLKNNNWEPLLDDVYYLYYRFSADGINYSAWSKYNAPALKYDHKLEHTIEVTNPIVLHEGENRIWIQAAFALPNTDPATIRPEMIATNNDQVIILDTTAPEYTFDLDGVSVTSIKPDSMEMTSSNLDGMLVFWDEYSSLDDLDWDVFDDNSNDAYNAIRGVDITEYVEELSGSSEGETVSPEGKATEGEVTEGETTEGETTESEDGSADGAPAVPHEKTLRIEVSDNGEHSVVLTDKVGNSVTIPVVVECIDKQPPDVTVNSNNPVKSGERQDYHLTFQVNQALDEKTRFALIKGVYPDGATVNPDSTDAPVYHPSTGTLIREDLIFTEEYAKYFGPLPENDAIKVLEQSTKFKYSNGESDTYYDVIIYADDLDPESETQESNFILAAIAEDALGNMTGTTIGYGMTLINATPEITDASCYPQIAHSKAAVSLSLTVPVYVLPADKVPAAFKSPTFADGRIDNLDDVQISDFAEYIVASASNYSLGATYIVNQYGNIPVYFADEAGRVYKQTIKVLDIGDTSEPDDLTVHVKFGNEAPVNAKLYYTEPGSTTLYEVLNNKLDAYDPNDGKTYYVEFTPGTDNAGRAVGLLNSEEFSSFYETTTINGDYLKKYDFAFSSCEYTESIDAYSSLIFSINPTPNNNKVLAFNVVIIDESEGQQLTETVGYVYELNIKDTTLPEYEIQYSTNEFTNKPVTVTVSAFDDELSTYLDASDTDSGDEAVDGAAKVISPAELAASRGISKMEIAYTAAKANDPSELATYTDLGQIAEETLTFTENGYAYVRITNTLGLVSYAEICVDNINTVAIAEADYKVTYRVVGGEYSPTGFYEKVTAEISITEDGNAKGVTVVNNGGKLTKDLTAKERTFTFTLRDKYGNSKDVAVSHLVFDTNAPMIKDCVLQSLEKLTVGTGDAAIKINVAPVKIYVADNATEGESGIKSVDITQYPASDTSESIDVSLEGTDEEGYNIYSAMIKQNGIYRVVVTDNCGNTAETSFTVTNVDNTPPYVVDPKYTVTGPTRGEVGVKFYFNEPNVTLTKVEIISGLRGNDISVNYNEAIIRFYEKGSVGLWFEDESGNEGSYVATVDNIFRKKPNIRVKDPVYAEDHLSAEVEFELADTTAEGNLSKYYVIYNGIAPVEYTYDEDKTKIESTRVLTADEVTFTFVDNGTYTFLVQDKLGNHTELDVTITEIDRTAPIITDVTWTYSYTDANGTEQTVTKSVTPGTEAGYNVVVDENNPATNQNITATVTTDKKTNFAGAPTEEKQPVNDETTSDSTDDNNSESGSEAAPEKHQQSIVYDKNGWFNFDMVAQNGLMDSYGLGLYLIDKEAPVIEGVEDLMFFENPNAGALYNASYLNVTAYDERYGVKTYLTDKVEISCMYDGKEIDISEIGSFPYDKSKPYTITYTVKDAVGNVAEARRTVTMVGLFDTTIRVNGGYTDANGMIEVDGNSVALTLDNFAGMAWARYESGIHTMGQMKNKGKVIAPQADGSFKLDNLSEGWYTFYVQTDLRDYFCVKVYVFAQ